jgi:hypothetical protein
MSTLAKLNANRANARLSTGPKTEAGKLASSRNSLKHGLTSKQVVVPGEDPAAYDELRRELHDDFNPASTAEATLVDQIAEHTWRLQRVRRAETAIMTRLIDDCNFRSEAALCDDQLDRIRRYEVTIERSYHRAIDQLRKLQKERRALEKAAAAHKPSAPGFVSQDDDPITALASPALGSFRTSRSTKPSPSSPRCTMRTRRPLHNASTKR